MWADCTTVTGKSVAINLDKVMLLRWDEEQDATAVVYLGDEEELFVQGHPATIISRDEMWVKAPFRGGSISAKKKD
jgi:hypothetical protein